MPSPETNPFAKPQVYYKYMGVSGFVHTITDSRLKLSRPDDFNDPFEFSPKFDFSHDVASREWAEFDPTALYEANHGNLIPKEVTLEEFKGSDPSDPRQLELLRECLEEKHSQNQVLRFQEQHSSFVRALCLTETSDNNLMWSHYTTNQTGICIGLTLGKHENAWSDPGKKGFSLKKTEYSSERAGIQMESIIEPFAMKPNRDRLERIYFRKSIDWSYENEWRIIYSENDSRIQKDRTLEMDFIPFSPSSDIEEIVVGNRIRYLRDRELFPMLKILCDTQNWANPPKIFQIKLRATKNELVKILRPDFKSFLGTICSEFFHVNTGNSAFNSEQERINHVKSKGAELAKLIYTLPADEFEDKLYAPKKS